MTEKKKWKKKDFLCPFCGADWREPSALSFLWTKLSFSRDYHNGKFGDDTDSEELDHIRCENCGEDVEKEFFDRGFEV